MSARDANNSTWYMLRYPEQFAVSATDTFVDSHTPYLGESLFYDDDRHVLELLPEPGADEIQPLSGLAVDVDGEIYRTDHQNRNVNVQCGQHVRSLLCETNVFIRPLGLALDRRGYLYVADGAARRVVVVLPDDGSITAIINTMHLSEPVDVALTPAGCAYVADRAGGQIIIYNSRFRYLKAFKAWNSEGLPQNPKPIAVMIDDDGTILVADANHPRLLHFTPAGEPLADVVLSTAIDQLAVSENILDALATIYGPRKPQFIAGNCCPVDYAREGGERLAAAHRILRLIRLRLGQRFAGEGIYISAAFDGFVPGTVWHRVIVDADIPENSTLTVETATADDADAIDLSSDSVWSAPLRPDGQPIPITPQIPEHLIQSGPGRYLWVRVKLTSAGQSTPSLRSIQILYPRYSYLDNLPRVYRRDPEGAWFLERFLALFEGIFTGIENRYELFSKQINPDAAPLDVINWLACLVDLSFDPSWSLQRRRDLVNRAMELYQNRGTPKGIADYIEIYTGVRPNIVEAFLQRPREAAFLGREGNILGCPMHLRPASQTNLPQEKLLRDYAHRFSVMVYITDACDSEIVIPVVNRIVEVNKPAHTAHAIFPIFPDMRVGVQSTVGLDTVLGGRTAKGARLSGCDDTLSPSTPKNYLGIDSILGERRPAYVRPFEIQL